MRRMAFARLLRCAVPALAAALVASIPCAAEARGGGVGIGIGGIGPGLGGFGAFPGGVGPGFGGLGAFPGGIGPGFNGLNGIGPGFGGLGAFPGGIGPGFNGFGAFPGGFARGGFTVFSPGAVAVPGFGRREGFGFDHRALSRFDDGYLLPRGTPVRGFGVPGIPFAGGGVSVPPFVASPVPRPAGGAAVRPPFRAAAPRPARTRVDLVEIWRRDAEGWRLDLASRPAAAWRRGQDGQWRPEPAG